MTGIFQRLGMQNILLTAVTTMPLNSFISCSYTNLLKLNSLIQIFLFVLKAQERFEQLDSYPRKRQHTTTQLSCNEAKRKKMTVLGSGENEMKRHNSDFGCFKDPRSSR